MRTPVHSNDRAGAHVEARVVVASIDTYLKYSEAVGQSVPVARPALESRPYDELMAENVALRAELSAADVIGATIIESPRP